MNIADQSEINKAVGLGLRSLEKSEPLRLSQWADENFYLSAESSYIEGAWESMPFQIGIMDCISNDDIREVTFKKSARVGYTKVILAALGYFAEHKKRNQAIWQPVDDDAEEFCKTELEPMIRDVACLRAILPSFGRKSKENTLSQKTYAGSTTYIRGGKAAKNYRRISVDVAYLDELSAFDRDIEREGDAFTLASKRVEGATFPKIVSGSTPKIKGECLIDTRYNLAEVKLTYHINCPHCGFLHALKWGGKDIPVGFKWVNDEPSTVGHLCPDCGSLYTQDQYLDVWKDGRWKDEDLSIYIDAEGYFRDSDGQVTDTPMSVGFSLWTAYSPMTSWSQIVREFIAAAKDPNKLKTFVNTTLGETWEEDKGEKLEKDHFFLRREHYQADVPQDVIILTAGIDTQDDRFEIQIDGWSEGEQRWSIDYTRLYGDPSRPEIWSRLADHLRKGFAKPDGTVFNIKMACQDHGGHYSDEVNQFSRKMGTHFLIPCKGSSNYGKPVANFPRKPNAKGVYLTEVGTDTAKELLFQRLKISDPGPGYWHWPISEQFDDEYFKQLTAEKRVPKWTQGQKRYVWDAQGRRNEPWDCSSLNLVAIRLLQQHFGVRLEVEQVASATKRRGVISEGVQV